MRMRPNRLTGVKFIRNIPHFPPNPGQCLVLNREAGGRLIGGSGGAEPPQGKKVKNV